MYQESVLPVRFFYRLRYLSSEMSQQGKTEHVCAFCTLVLQIGYDELTGDDIAKIAVHMRIAHGLQRYEIPV